MAYLNTPNYGFPTQNSTAYTGPAIQQDAEIQFYFQIGFWVCIAIVLFLIFRFVNLWYWKINEMVKLLEKIEFNTRRNSTYTISQKPETEEAIKKS